MYCQAVLPSYSVLHFFFFLQCVTYVQFLYSSGCSSDQPQSMEPMPSGGSPSLQGDLWLRNQSAEAACPALTQLHPLKGDVALFLPIHLSVDHRESLESWLLEILSSISVYSAPATAVCEFNSS